MSSKKQQQQKSFKDWFKSLGEDAECLYRFYITKKLQISNHVYYNYTSGRTEVPFSSREHIDKIVGQKLDYTSFLKKPSKYKHREGVEL